jgi:hypothetical protein
MTPAGTAILAMASDPAPAYVVREAAAYAGCDQRGHGRNGTFLLTDVAAEVEARFVSGWPSLRVMHDGALIAAIGRHDGRRVWWSR